MNGISITKMSSRGQVVIPLEMRKDLAEGVKLVVMRNKGQIILKKADDFAENIEEDLEFARRTEEAWKSYDRGEFKTYSEEEFLEKLEKW